MFVKVSKRVGAVAVYSPARAIALVAAVVVVIAVAAFFGGRASKGDTAAAEAPPPAPAKAPPAAAADPETAPVDAKRAGRRVYRRGYRAGAEAAAPGGSGFFKPGEAYLLKIERGRNGAPYSVGPHVRIDPGFRYRICQGGTKICVVPVTAGEAETPARSGTTGANGSG